MLEHKIFTVLSKSSAVSGYIGSRIYPLIMPQDVALPAMTYQRIDTPRYYSLTGDAGGESPRIQMDVYAPTWSEAGNVADTIKTAMDGSTTFKVLDYNRTDLYESDLQIYRIQADFVIWNQE